MYNMPGSPSVRDLRFVGKGACAAALERAGMGTIVAFKFKVIEIIIHAFNRVLYICMPGTGTVVF